jgi:V-type H+-transporting ATPase subunit a
MARRVRFFATQIEKEKDVIPVRPLYDSAPLLTVGPRAAQTMDELDVKLSEHEKRLTQMNDSYQLLSDRLTELIEAQHVLKETAVFFRRVSRFFWQTWGPSVYILQASTHRDDIRTSFDDSSAPLLQHEDRESGYSSGVQFDLEYVWCTVWDDLITHISIGSLRAPLTGPASRPLNGSYGVCCAGTCT